MLEKSNAKIANLSVIMKEISHFFSVKAFFFCNFALANLIPN